MEQIKPGESVSFTVNLEDENTRLDVFITNHLTLYSRSFFQKLIELKFVKINEIITTKKQVHLKAGDTVLVTFPPPRKLETEKIIESNLGVKVIQEHSDFLIIFKPAGVIVHEPTSSLLSKKLITLVDWLLVHFKEISKVGESERPGIVHRLDKNTSGIMIIPRKDYVHAIFSEMFKDRKIKKTYLAIVEGHPDPKGTIDLPISRHPTEKIKMSHLNPAGKDSTTTHNWTNSPNQGPYGRNWTSPSW